MKKAKLISAISLVMLCICMLCVGVVSATSIKDEMGMGGVISIPTNNISVEVKAYIGSYTLDNLPASPDFDSNDGEVWQLTEEQQGRLKFNTDNVNSLDDLKAATVTITFVIKNNSDLLLEAYFSKLLNDTQTRISEDELKDKNNVLTVKSTLVSNEVPSLSTGTLVSIVFSQQRFVEESFPLDFNYMLNIVEKISDEPAE